MLAVRLVDLALAAEFGLQRLDRDAVRLHATIAAALADQLVDDHALVGVRVGAALASAALLGGAGLVVEQERDTGDRGQFALDGVEFVAMVQRRAGRPLRARRIFAWVVADHGDAGDALGRDLPRHLVRREMALGLLAAGHGDRVVVEQLVGKGDAARDGPADSERAGMGIGAVAEILEDMAALRERRLADPVRAFAAHLGEAGGVAVHPLHHVMAADAGIGARALRHHGRGIMRAARAEIGRAAGDLLRLGEAALRRGDLLQPGAERRVVAVLQQAAAQRDRDIVGVERAMDREEPVAVLVLLADHHRLVLGAVKLLADLDLDQRALLLDHHDQVESFREGLQLGGIDRPGTGELEQADAEIIGADLVDAEIDQGLLHVEIGFADGGDADARLLAAMADDAVQLVGAQIGQHRIALVEMHPAFLLDEIELAADSEAAGRRGVIGRSDDGDAVERTVDGGRRFDVILDAFDADPDRGEARQRDTVQAVIDDLLHAGRVEDRHHPVDQHEFGLMGVGRGFRRVIVAHQADHAALRIGASHVAVAEDVAGAVDARPLAVPEREDAVMLAFAAQARLLRAPDRGRGEVLVEARLEDDVRGSQRLGRSHQLLVEPPERGAAIAGNEAGGVEPGQPVALALHQQHAGDGLRTGEEDLSLVEIVFVVERDVPQRSRLGAGFPWCLGHVRPPGSSFPPTGR